MKGKKSYSAYVVWKGRRTGVFERWEEVHDSTDGFQGSCFKGYSALQGAEQAWRARGKPGGAVTRGRARMEDAELVGGTMVVDCQRDERDGSVVGVAQGEGEMNEESAETEAQSGVVEGNEKGGEKRKESLVTNDGKEIEEESGDEMEEGFEEALEELDKCSPEIDACWVLCSHCNVSWGMVDEGEESKVRETRKKIEEENWMCGFCAEKGFKVMEERIRGEMEDLRNMIMRFRDGMEDRVREEVQDLHRAIDDMQKAHREEVEILERRLASLEYESRMGESTTEKRGSSCERGGDREGGVGGKKARVVEGDEEGDWSVAGSKRARKEKGRGEKEGRNGDLRGRKRGSDLAGGKKSSVPVENLGVRNNNGVRDGFKSYCPGGDRKAREKSVVRGGEPRNTPAKVVGAAERAVVGSPSDRLSPVGRGRISERKEDKPEWRVVAKGLVGTEGEEEIVELIEAAAGCSVRFHHWWSGGNKKVLVIQLKNGEDRGKILRGKAGLRLSKRWNSVFFGEDRPWRERQRFREALEMAWKKAGPGGSIRVIGGVPHPVEKGAPIPVVLGRIGRQGE